MFELVLYMLSGVNVITWILAGWLVVLSVVLAWVVRLYVTSTRLGKEKNIIKVLNKLIENSKETAGEIKENSGRIEILEQKSLLGIQRVGLVKYNPFEETGGNNSFSLALLNDQNDGIVISGLHTRERTRLYVKRIKSGKSDLDLSEEEKEAIRKSKTLS